MTHDTQNPQPQPQKINPDTLPDDLTAASLARCVGKTLGADHPAARLDAMKEGLYSMIVLEGQGESRLIREIQVLDALFNVLLQEAMDPENPTDPLLMALALRAQKQAQDTQNQVFMMPYMKVMREYIASKPSESLADTMLKRARRRDPDPAQDDAIGFHFDPLVFEEQKEGPQE